MISFIKKILNNIIIIFFKTLGYEIEIKNNRYTFLGIYSSYKEAQLKAKNNSTYTHQENEKVHSLEKLENIEVSGRAYIFTIFCAINSNEFNDKSNFLEIGGGTTPTFLYILKSINKKYKFKILEHKNFRINIPNEYKVYLDYITQLKDINLDKLDSVIFSSSIQYMENYKEVLDKIFASRIKYIFITETIFTEMSEDIFSLQNNVGNTRFPYIFFSYKKLNQLFCDNNYKLTYNSK